MESDYIWDPLRKKSVRNTPEEAVRQWFIGVLHEGMKVPEHMMGSEVAFSHAGKDYRADVVVYDRKARPLMVVECKAATVALTDVVLDQAVRYHSVIQPRYLFLTNGATFYCYKAEGQSLQPLDHLPTYAEMMTTDI